jgi:hypothetical protein
MNLNYVSNLPFLCASHFQSAFTLEWRSAHWVGLVQKPPTVRGPHQHGLSPRKLENVKTAG